MRRDRPASTITSRRVLGILPCLLSLVFYKRRPSRLQIAMGPVATIALCALIGYVQLEGVAKR